MEYFSESILAAIGLIVDFDKDLYQIVATSVKISCIALLIAALIGVPVGGWVALSSFRGKYFLQSLLNTLMAMPTVMIGLIFYGLLSRRGPLGDFGLLYTPTAVVIGEFVLILPIIINLAASAVNSSDPRLVSTLQSMGANKWQLLSLVLLEVRMAVAIAVVTGFGRAIGEVGAAMMLGGNIQGVTRTMTTAIALETSKGEFELGLALGILLLAIAFSVNWLLQRLHFYT